MRQFKQTINCGQVIYVDGNYGQPSPRASGLCRCGPDKDQCVPGRRAQAYSRSNMDEFSANFFISDMSILSSNLWE
jgi:hypothetical protein